MVDLRINKTFQTGAVRKPHLPGAMEGRVRKGIVETMLHRRCKNVTLMLGMEEPTSIILTQVARQWVVARFLNMSERVKI